MNLKNIHKYWGGRGREIEQGVERLFSITTIK